MFVRSSRFLTRFSSFDYYTSPAGFMPYSVHVPEAEWSPNRVFNLSISYVRDARLKATSVVKTKTALYDKFLLGGQKQMLSLYNDAIANFSQVQHGRNISAITRGYMCLTPDHLYSNDKTTIEIDVIRDLFANKKDEDDDDEKAEHRNATLPSGKEACPLDIKLRVQSNPFETANNNIVKSAVGILEPTFQLLKIHCVLYKEDYNVVEPVTIKTIKKSPNLSSLPQGVKIINRFQNMTAFLNPKNETTKEE